MGSKGKLEARITVPTGGWDVTVGGVGKTIPAGTYYLSSPGSGARDFLDEVAFQFGASSVSASLGEAGTGIVTITFGVATAITWTDLELRDLLGFTGNLGAATSHVSTQSARNVWLPDVEANRLNAGGHWRGYREGDYRVVSNPAGHVWAVMGQERVALDDLVWHGLKQSRVWIENETTVNQSLERFWRDGVWATTASWGTAGGPVRYHPDASNDTDYGTYKVLDTATFRPDQVVRDYVGLWRWQLPKLIQVPGSEAQGLGGTTRATISVALWEAASSTVDGTVFTTGAHLPTANKLNLIDIESAVAAGSAESPTSVVGAGVTWVKVAERATSGGLRMVSRWRALGAAPSNGALTITFLSSHTSCGWAWVEFTNASTEGLNGSGAIVQTVTAQSAGAVATLNNTLAALEHATNVHYACVGLNANDAIAPDPQFTELSEDPEVTSALELQTEYAANQTAVDPTWVSAQAVIISSEIKSAWV